MNPIYNEYLTFLRDTTKQPLEDLKEGYFWLDKSIIKGFDKQGNEHKFYRVKIENSLERLDCTKLKSYDNISDVDLASWQDLIELQKEHLTQLEADSLELIKEKTEKFNTYTSIIPVSMGKDSMLTCHLVRKLYPETKAIFNNTSLDCADTYRMVKTFPNCEIMNPEKGFYQYVESDHMIPTRFARFCCRIFKVGVMVSQLDHNHPYLMWMGMRNEESNTRSGYQDEWINEQEWGKTCWQGILPIRKWSEMDVWLYTIWKNIEINPKYKKGYSRCGCNIACPFYTKSTWILDKYWYPQAYERWRNILKEDFIAKKKWIIMNCTIDEYLTQELRHISSVEFHIHCQRCFIFYSLFTLIAILIKILSCYFRITNIQSIVLSKFLNNLISWFISECSTIPSLCKIFINRAVHDYPFLLCNKVFF